MKNNWNDNCQPYIAIEWITETRIANAISSFKYTDKIDT